MDNEIIIKSLSDHLQQLSSYFNWMFAIAVAGIYMTLTKQKELNLKIVNVQRDDAVIAASSLFILLNIAMIILTVRMYFLLRSLPPTLFLKAFTTLTTTSWIVNPFAYFGEGTLFINLCSAVGLVVAWWVAYFSVSVMPAKSFRFKPVIMAIIILVLGVVLYLSIHEVYLLIGTKLASMQSTVSTSLFKPFDVWVDTVGYTTLLLFIASLIAAYYFDKSEKKNSLYKQVKLKWKGIDGEYYYEQLDINDAQIKLKACDDASQNIALGEGYSPNTPFWKNINQIDVLLEER